MQFQNFRSELLDKMETKIKDKHYIMWFLLGHNWVNIPIAFILTISCPGRAFIHPSYVDERNNYEGGTKQS